MFERTTLNTEHLTEQAAQTKTKVNKNTPCFVDLGQLHQILRLLGSYSANLWVQRFHRQAYLIISLLPGFKSHCQATSIRVLRAVVNPDPTKIINLGRRQAVPECNIFASRTIDRHGPGSKS